MGLRALEIARSALIVQRQQIELIGHNIANVQTPGYNCRRALLAQIPSGTALGVLGIGQGVEAIRVQRLGDRLLEAQINVETGRLGREETVAKSLAEMEAVISGPNGRGLLDPLNDLFDAFSGVAADPSAPTPRREVLARAETLCDAFQRAGVGLRSMLERNDQQVVKAVREINRLAKEVAKYNEIVGAAGGLNKAPDVEDKRALAVASLARLCGAVGVQRDNGYVDVLVGGHYLVQGERFSKFEATQVAGNPPRHEVSFHNESPPPLLDGELAGLLEAREKHIEPARAQLNQLAISLATEVNRQHQAGYDLDGNPGLAFFMWETDSPAATLALNPELASQPRRFAAASEPGETANGQNALRLEALRLAKVLDGGTISLIDSHTDFLAGIGVDRQMAETRSQARQDVVSALEGRYQEVAGVALDEEAMRLIEAEKAYQVAQRVVQVVMNLIDHTLRLEI